MMVDGAEERQLKGPIDVLAPYTTADDARCRSEVPAHRFDRDFGTPHLVRRYKCTSEVGTPSTTRWVRVLFD
jgi:hypothetical protein